MQHFKFNSVYENQADAINFCKQELHDILNNWDKEKEYEIICEQKEENNNTVRVFVNGLVFAPEYTVTKCEVK
jgi:hypothetical protein